MGRLGKAWRNMTTTTEKNVSLPDSLQALMSRAGAKDKTLPQVDKWNPPFCGDLDIRIARDGT